MKKKFVVQIQLSELINEEGDLVFTKKFFEVTTHKGLIETLERGQETIKNFIKNKLGREEK